MKNLDLACSVFRKTLQFRGCRLYTRGGRQWIARTVRGANGQEQLLPIGAHQKAWQVSR